MTNEVSGFELGTDGPSLIMVGVDGSRTSLRAAAYAAGLARRQGCPLAVVHVSHVGSAGVNAGAAMAMAQTALELADDLEEQVRAGSQLSGVDARFHVRAGDPYREITQAADELRADLVVVGASEQAGHRLVGSLAAKLVRSGRWPVTVVP